MMGVMLPNIAPVSDLSLVMVVAMVTVRPRPDVSVSRVTVVTVSSLQLPALDSDVIKMSFYSRRLQMNDF